jgi:AraC-like DNA-binding protein
MSKTRQDPYLVRSFGLTLLSPTSLTYTTRGWDRLVYARRGAVTVRTSSGSWVLPAQRALWVPADIDHEVIASGPVSLRSLYLIKGLARCMPKQCQAVNISPLLRELILHIVKLSVLDSREPVHKHLIAVLVDQLATLDSIPLQLPEPADPRARRAVAFLRSNLAAKGHAHGLSKASGASTRTLERIFLAETGMTLGAWSRRLRVLHALELLAAGQQVTQVAMEAGYESTSAFVSMFRKELGVTPGRYYARSR